MTELKRLVHELELEYLVLCLVELYLDFKTAL